MKKPDSSLVLSALNEGEVIEDFLEELQSSAAKKRIAIQLILINNGSSDNTSEIMHRVAQKHSECQVIDLPSTAGYGKAIRTGIRYCKGRWIGWAWTDNQISGRDVIKVLEIATRKFYTRDDVVVKGFRIVRKYSLLRKIQSQVYNALFRILLPIKSLDINGCPKFFSALILERIALESSDWFLDGELMLKARLKQFHIVEVPVQYNERKGGQSKAGLTTSFEFLKNIIKWKFFKKPHFMQKPPREAK